MCGRLFQTLPLFRLLQIARTSKVTNSDKHTSSCNVCPTTFIPVIKHSPLYDEVEENPQPQEKQEQSNNKEEHKDREVTFMKWGKQTQHNMIINGRIEELTAKKTFLNIIQNRCVVIMEGYFEWQTTKQKEKQPYCFRSKNEDHFLVAGLYTPENEIIILTKDAIPSISHIHERMPVILSGNQVSLWLDPKNTASINTLISKSLLDKEKPIWKNVGFAQIAPHVNKISEKSVKCLMSLEQYNKERDRTGIMRYMKKLPKVEAVGKDGEVIQEKEVGCNDVEKKETVRKNLVEGRDEQQSEKEK